MVNAIILTMRVAIIGLGLIGGSMGMALKKKSWQSAEITGWVRRLETGEEAVKMKAIDKFELSLKKVVQDADIIIIATPVLAIKEIFSHITSHIQENCIVTDVASTKVEVMRWARELLPRKVNFIGGHPMAGKEMSGIKVADANLFKGCVYCLVQGSNASTNAMQSVNDIVLTIGATPLLVEAQKHDNLVAGISHLPFLLSTALVLATTKSTSWPQLSQLASSGYRDLTRLASGNPEMNTSICLTNQSSILYWIDIFIKELQKLRGLIGNSDSGIEDALHIAKEARTKWLENH
jgi:prephenate dehydrogenase